MGPITTTIHKKNLFYNRVVVKHLCVVADCWNVNFCWKTWRFCCIKFSVAPTLISCRLSFVINMLYFARASECSRFCRRKLLQKVKTNGAKFHFLIHIYYSFIRLELRTRNILWRFNLLWRRNSCVVCLSKKYSSFNNGLHSFQ